MNFSSRNRKEKEEFKLLIIIGITVIMLLSFSLVAFGAVTYGIKFTKHNLGSTVQNKGTGSQWWSTNETEICIFCHTPHNSNNSNGKKFLWNRNNPTVTFYPYTGSPTLNFSKPAGFPISEVSKMCMSCHDGVSAVNVLFNTRPITVQGHAEGELASFGEFDFVTAANIGGGTASAPGSGGDLTNDHPISFTYDPALISADGTLNPLDGGGNSVGGLPLWSGKVECVTCHDPHINYNPTYGGNASLRPFLRKSNNSSNLCFTCHNK